MPESSAHRLVAVLSGQSTEDSDVDSGTSTPPRRGEVIRLAAQVRETLGDEWERRDLEEALDGYGATDKGLRAAVGTYLVRGPAGLPRGPRGRVRMGDGGSATSRRPNASAARLAEDL